MEFAIRRVSWIAEGPGPHLLASSVVPRQHRDVTGGISDPIRLVGGAWLILQVIGWLDSDALIHLSVRTNRLPCCLAHRATAFDGVRFGEEDPDTLLLEEGLDGGTSDPVNRLLRRSSGPIGALRKPDRGRRSTERSLIGTYSGPKLREDRRVAPQQRQVPMRRSACRNLDVPFVLQGLERTKDVTVVT